MLVVDLPCFNQCNHRIQMVTLCVLFGNLGTQQKLERVCYAGMCGALQALSSSTETVVQSSCFSDQISGLALFWKFALSSFDAEALTCSVLGIASPNLALLLPTSICTS